MKLIVAAALVLAAAACPARAALVVSSGATSNVSCASGVCTATAADAVLNAKDFRHMIGAGDLTLVSGSAAQDIVIDAKIHWTAPHNLTLDAYRGITFLLELVSEGGGGATLKIDDGGTGGDITFTLGKGKLTFWDTSSSLVIGGFSVTLVNDLPTLIADIAANPRGGFALARGYDASVDGTYAGAPIPTLFSGVFNGLGHEITNLTIDYNGHKETPIGLFATMDGSATNLALAAVSVTSNGRLSYTGMLAGTANGTIQNVSVAGRVHARTKQSGFAGGLVGQNQGVVNATRASGQVTGSNTVIAAGLVALNSGRILRSTSSMAVISDYMACGLVGEDGGPDGQVEWSSATGAVSIRNPTIDAIAAGLICTSSGAISQSFSTSPVYAGSVVNQGGSDWTAYGGGLIAFNSGSIIDCYATGAVSAQNSLLLGGLVSSTLTGISTSYSTGAVSPPQAPDAGGLVGDVPSGGGSDFDSYWDLDTSGVSNPSQGAGNVANAPGITGLTTPQFKLALPTGFSAQVWAQSPSINNGYPYLIANPPQ